MSHTRELKKRKTKPCSHFLYNIKTLVNICSEQERNIEGYREILRRIKDFKSCVDHLQEEMIYSIEIEEGAPPKITEEDEKRAYEDFKKACGLERKRFINIED